jgi:hypothetical protein
MAATCQATRRCRLRQAQAENDAGARAAEETEEKEELEDVKTPENDVAEVGRSPPYNDSLDDLLNTATGATGPQRPPSRAREY